MGNSNLYIDPMMAMFNKPYNKTDEQLKYVLNTFRDELAGHTDEAIKRAWEHTSKTHNRQTWPTLPEICTALRIVTDKIAAENHRPQSKRELTEAEIFASEGGKMALRDGFSRSYLVECQRQNKIIDPDETQKYIMRWYRARQEINIQEELAAIKDAGLRGTVRSCYNTMQQVERDLQEKWG